MWSRANFRSASLALIFSLFLLSGVGCYPSQHPNDIYRVPDLVSTKRQESPFRRIIRGDLWGDPNYENRETQVYGTSGEDALWSEKRVFSADNSFYPVKRDYFFPVKRGANPLYRITKRDYKPS